MTGRLFLRSVLCVSWVAATVFPLGSTAQSPYEGLVPVGGDVHHHAGSLTMNYQLRRLLDAEISACPHSTGEPIYIYSHQQLSGYDWTVISHHDFTTTGDETGASREAYLWYTDPNAEPIVGTDQEVLVQPDPGGLPDYENPGQTFGADETLSFASAAAASTNPGVYLAFSGREFSPSTPASGAAVGSQPEEGGHKVAILPGASDRICGAHGAPTGLNPQGAYHRCDETDLYRFVRDEGGAIIQAHPSNWLAGLATPWHPTTARGGVTDAFVQGVEIGKKQGFVSASFFGYQAGLAHGLKLFPAYGSDEHKNAPSNWPLCRNSAVPTSTARGATMCWIPAGGLTYQAVIDAMEARNCYYSRSHLSELRFEARGAVTPPEPAVPMGSELSSPDGRIHVTVFARNDAANQAPALNRRLDRVEIVQVTGRQMNGAPITRIVYDCTSCCTSDPNGDFCSIVDEPIELVDAEGDMVPGPLFVHGCQAPVGSTCGIGSNETHVVSAPIFVNWSAYKQANGLPDDPACDFDGDGLSCFDDLCWGVPSTNADTDGDDVGDECDNCPLVPNRDQTDADDDDIGDACQPGDTDGDGLADSQDVCPEVPDAPQVDSDLDGLGDVCDPCPDDPNNEDDDGDGVGSACDVCPMVPDPDQANSDSDSYGDACDNCYLLENENQSDIDQDGVGDACDGDIDGDGEPNASDNCPLHPNPDQTDVDAPGDPGYGAGEACDADRDGVRDPFDLCPTVHDPTNADSGETSYGSVADGVGDACDTCVHHHNPRIDPALQPAYRTTLGAQLDDDADGFGNACDLDFNRDGLVDGLDQLEVDLTFPFVPTSGSSCGSSHTLRCDQFSLSLSATVDLQDLVALLNEVSAQIASGTPPIEKCADCGTNRTRIACVGDSCIHCSDGIDNDSDGATDHPADTGCVVADGVFENPVCSDGIDNDGDTFTDWPDDPGCARADASIEDPDCNDGLDNDGDGFTDFPDDPDCVRASEQTEVEFMGCGLGFEVAIVLVAIRWVRRAVRRRAPASSPSSP